MKAATDAGMPRKPLTLIVQRPELTHLHLAQRRPKPEEARHARIATVPCSPKLLGVESREIPGEIPDHGAPAPNGALCGLLPSPANHLRIFARNPRVNCIGHLASAALSALARGSRRKERMVEQRS
jgi:hypothetical protein